MTGILLDMPTTGSILQLACGRCGHVNTYRREMVAVGFLNDERAKLERVCRAADDVLAYDDGGPAMAAVMQNLRATVERARALT